jgi:hypothetical protein
MGWRGDIPSAMELLDNEMERRKSVLIGATSQWDGEEMVCALL